MPSILVCGGGNGAHVHAVLAASQGMDVAVLTLYADEAERWDANQKAAGGLTGLRYVSGKLTETIKVKPEQIKASKDAAAVVPGRDIIVLCVPAFAHEEYLQAIAPLVGPDVCLVGQPGQCGFELQARHILGDKAKAMCIINMESLPWAARMTKFGEEVEILGTKETLTGCVMLGPDCPRPTSDFVALLQKSLTAEPVLKIYGHVLGATLMAVNAIIHPAILYGQWKDWESPADGHPDESPLFYQGLSQFAADTMTALSQEVMDTAVALNKHNAEVGDFSSVKSIHDWYVQAYPNDIDDKTSLYSTLRTNNAYRGLRHPTVADEATAKHNPNFKNRYFTEDIPCGLVVLRGIAEVAGVPTPVTDKVLLWSQRQMGKEYLVDGKIAGKDVSESRAPQKYGFITKDSLLGC